MIDLISDVEDKATKTTPNYERKWPTCCQQVLKFDRDIDSMFKQHTAGHQHLKKEGHWEKSQQRYQIWRRRNTRSATMNHKMQTKEWMWRKTQLTSVRTKVLLVLITKTTKRTSCHKKYQPMSRFQQYGCFRSSEKQPRGEARRHAGQTNHQSLKAKY